MLERERKFTTSSALSLSCIESAGGSTQDQRCRSVSRRCCSNHGSPVNQTRTPKAQPSVASHPNSNSRIRSLFSGRATVSAFQAHAISDPYKTFGSRELRTWCCGPGISRFQTSSPRFARKLSQRGNARLVAWSVHKEYLRVFEEPIEAWRARRLVSRYLKATNGSFAFTTGIAFSSAISSSIRSAPYFQICFQGISSFPTVLLVSRHSTN